MPVNNAPNDYLTEDNSHEKEYPTEDNAPVNKNETEDETPNEERDAKEKAPKKPKTEEKRFNVSPFIVVFGVLMLIAFVFSIAGISIGMMSSREDSSCWSIWGFKPRCYGTWFRSTNWTKILLDRGAARECDKPDSLMQAAQAFSIMTIVGLFFTVIVSILQVLDFADLKVVAVIVGSVTTVANLVTWSTMLALYWSNLCGSGVFADNYRIGPGLILYITGWCLEMIALTLMIYHIANS